MFPIKEIVNSFLYTSILLILPGFSQHFQSPEEEYTLKAAYIYNFTKYIKWDASISENEFIIGVIGTSPIYTPLETLAQNKSINDKKIVLRQFKNLEEINFCHILFISKNTPFTINQILSHIKYNTLTISETNDYAAKGAAINFIIVNGKLKFEINRNAINSSGLTASSELLKLAVIIE